MITWGILAGATAAVTGANSFAVVRFLLGSAEAGFFPGIVLYFTYWFPTYHHARIVSGFLIGLPIAVAAGAPVSTALLGLDGMWGLKGWQIMYIAEGVPTVLIGLLTFFVLTDRPGAGEVPDGGGEGLAERDSWPPNGGAKEAVKNVQLLAGDVRSEGAAAGAELFRHRRGQPRRAVLRAADHQVDRRHQQHDRRLADDDPVHLRRHRPGGLGPRVRPDERAALESARRLRAYRRSD